MSLLLLFAALLLAAPAQAQVFARIADQDTPVPGGLPGETFSTFNDEHPPLVSKRCIVFRGQGNMGLEGIYLVRHGVIELVADRSTLVPGGVGGIEKFEEFEESLALDDCDVAFDGTGNDATLPTLGIYLKREGMPLEVVADTNTAAPAGTFSDFEDPWLEDDIVVFVAATAGGGCDSTTIYKTDGVGGFVVVVDSCGSTPVPAGLPGETFAELDTRPVLEDGVLTFTGAGNMGTGGVYAEIGGVLLVVADTNTPIPGRGGAVFNQFGGIAPTSGGDTVFLGAGPESMPPFAHAGLYRASPRGISIVIDLVNPPPLPGWDPGDLIGPDFAFWFSGDLVTLGAVGTTSPETVFLIQGAEISSLAAVGDTLGGMTIEALPRFAHCTGDRIVFVPDFPMTQALYLASLPLFEDGFESGDTTAWSNTVQ